jgi:hypothetical protein
MARTYRILISLLVGVLVVSLPLMLRTAKLDNDLLSFIAGIILIPGVLVAVVASGNIHEANPYLLFGVSGVWYAAFTYLLISGNKAVTKTLRAIWGVLLGTYPLKIDRNAR